MITFAEILKDKGYPGFDPVKHVNAPWVSDQLSLFKPEDEARFWFKGFQWPRAYPLNFVWLEDGFAWGTQAAARQHAAAAERWTGAARCRNISFMAPTSR